MKVFGFTNKGYEGQVTGIECDIRNGFPGFDIVGLPDTGIKESKERVRSAIRNSGFKFPQQRILVSLYPAGEHKSGALLDLGIALSILLAPFAEKSSLRIMTAGELTLGGSVVPAPQALGAVNAASNAGCPLCLVPFESDRAMHVTSLRQAFEICAQQLKSPILPVQQQHTNAAKGIFDDIFAMDEEKEILCAAAAGFHSIFMFGPPGVGKTLLCSRINRLLPPPDSKTTEELTRIYGCASLTPPPAGESVCRALGIDSTSTQFTGTRIPGEGALAHAGVLMMDEVNHLSPKLTETVRTAYDRGYCGTYPARFLMAANMNVCPCGGLGRQDAVCICSNHRLESYWKRPGTAFLERFDIRIPVKPFNILAVSETPKPDTFYTDRIAVAAERQRHRFREIDGVDTNGQVHLNPLAVRVLEKEGNAVSAVIAGSTSSPRSVIGTTALARTLADMEDMQDIGESHIMQALELRRYGFGDYYWKDLR